MSRQFRKPKTAKDRFDQEDAAQKFLDAAHGYETTRRECGKSTTFSTLVTKATDARLTNKGELRATWGIDLAKAKKRHRLNVADDKQEDFINVISNRAVEKGAAVTMPG